VEGYQLSHNGELEVGIFVFVSPNYILYFGLCDDCLKGLFIIADGFVFCGHKKKLKHSLLARKHKTT
jgi:hypothetical protein